MAEALVSKVLVLDDSPTHFEAIKRFCDENGLVGLKVRKNRLMSVLRSNIDLGAILYSETYRGSPEENTEIALKIHTIRPEVPLILRRENDETLNGVPEGLNRILCGDYSASNKAGWRKTNEE